LEMGVDLAMPGDSETEDLETPVEWVPPRPPQSRQRKDRKSTRVRSTIALQFSMGPYSEHFPVVTVHFRGSSAGLPFVDAKTASVQESTRRNFP
jgi:hypothetical protein